MKVARLDTLSKQDDIFVGGEPEGRYKKRQLIAVADDYDFEANSATDITDAESLKFVYSWAKMNYIEYRDSLIYYAEGITFSSLSNKEKETLAKNFAVDKTSRDSVYTSNEQEKHAKEVQELVDEANQQISFESGSSTIVDESGVPDLTNSTSSIVYGSYIAEVSSEGETSTNSSSGRSTKLTLTTVDLTSGKYRIGWYYETRGSTNKDLYSNIVLDGSLDLSENRVEFQDSDNWEPNSGFKYETLTSGVHTIDIKFRPSSNTTVRIRRARLEILKIT